MSVKANTPPVEIKIPRILYFVTRSRKRMPAKIGLSSGEVESSVSAIVGLFNASNVKVSNK